jgi:hypothetical protein
MSAGATEMVAVMMNDLLVLGHGREVLVEDLDEGDFRRYGPRVAGMASVGL